MPVSSILNPKFGPHHRTGHSLRTTVSLLLSPPRRLLRSPPSRKSASAPMPISSRSSMRSMLEPPSPRRRNAITWPSSSTCHLGASRYGSHPSQKIFNRLQLLMHDFFLYRFQNKRQSMRQTNRQSTNSSSLSQQSYAMTSSGASHSSSRGLGPVGPTTDSSYISASQDHARTHQSSSPQRRLQTAQEDAMDPRKWSSRGF